MDLIVTPAVLIPRPETEHVIETVLELRTSRLSPGLQPWPQRRAEKFEVRGSRSEVRCASHARRRHRLGLHCPGPSQGIS